MDLAILVYRNTPVYQSYSPSQILYSRRLRDNLPNSSKHLEPKLLDKKFLHGKIKSSQLNIRKYYDQGTQVLPKLAQSENVKYQNHPKARRQFAKIEQELRDRTYKLRKEDGSTIIRNRKYIKATKVDVKVDEPSSCYDMFDEHLLKRLKNIPENVNNNPDNDEISDSDDDEITLNNLFDSSGYSDSEENLSDTSLMRMLINK